MNTDEKFTEYRFQQVDKFLDNLDKKLDKAITASATKVELADAIVDRDYKIEQLQKSVSEKIDKLDRSVNESMKRKTLTANIAIIVAIVSAATTIIMFYELFRIPPA